MSSTIWDLAAVTSLVDTDELPVGRDPDTKKATVETLRSAMPGYELAYQEFTSNVSITSGDGDNPTDVVSSGAVTYDGTRVCIEFFAVIVEPANADFISICLWDASTRMGEMAEVALSGTRDVTVLARRYLTPSAASHTYRIRAFRNAGNGTLYAGAGGSGQHMPGYIRVTTAPA